MFRGGKWSLTTVLSKCPNILSGNTCVHLTQYSMLCPDHYELLKYRSRIADLCLLEEAIRDFILGWMLPNLEGEFLNFKTFHARVGEASLDEREVNVAVLHP